MQRTLTLLGAGALAAIVLAVALPVTTAVEQGSGGHHGTHGDHRGSGAVASRCIQACTTCLLDCSACYRHCVELTGAGQTEHAATLQLCNDCAQICALAAQLTARQGPLAVEVCQACAEACQRCAAACACYPDHPHMVRCAESCRACAEACREMVAQ